MAVPHLLLPDGRKCTLYLDRNLTIGRIPGVDLILEDPGNSVSRRHARVEPKESGWFVRDLGSEGGTRLNGRSLTANVPHALQHGDILDIGTHRVTFIHGAVAVATNRLVARLSAEELQSRATPVASSGGKGERPSALVDHIQLVRRAADPDALLEALIELAHRAAGGERAWTGLIDRKSGEWRSEQVWPIGARERGDFVRHQAVIDRALNDGEAVVIADPVDESAPAPTGKASRVRAVLCCPIPGEAGSIGAIYAEDRSRPDAFSAADLEQVALLGVLAGELLRLTRKGPRKRPAPKT